MGKGMLDGRIKERNNVLYIASHIHPSIAFTSPSLPSVHNSYLHLSNFKALWRENMSVTGGRNPGRPVLLAQTRTTNTRYHAHKASSE